MATLAIPAVRQSVGLSVPILCHTLATLPRAAACYAKIVQFMTENLITEESDSNSDRFIMAPLRHFICPYGMKLERRQSG